MKRTTQQTSFLQEPKIVDLRTLTDALTPLKEDAWRDVKDIHICLRFHKKPKLRIFGRELSDINASLISAFLDHEESSAEFTVELFGENGRPLIRVCMILILDILMVDQDDPLKDILYMYYKIMTAPIVKRSLELNPEWDTSTVHVRQYGLATTGDHNG